MRKKIIISLIWLIGLIGMAQNKFCYSKSPNNKVGIHILETSEIEGASKLINSSNGDWGYVTIVLRQDDLDWVKWQEFMNNCRRLHVIPIVRLTTKADSAGNWEKPNPDDLQSWAQFLNSLTWPVKEQLVTIFNEPNHATEWGGSVNPGEYALVLDKSINLFKSANPNFVVLNAGLDQAADGNKETMREEEFLQAMEKAVPGIFGKLGGWASHSYPNHGFVGNPSDTGRGSIKGYLWELGEIKKVETQDFASVPVYITETGWPHKEGEGDNPDYYPEEKTGELMLEAFKIWEDDRQVKAVTPFVFNYPAKPFDNFSWTKKDGSFYPVYDKVLSLGKVKAEPEQVESYEIMAVKLPDLLPTNYTYKAKIKIKNTGQWIIGERKPFELKKYQGYSGIQPRRLNDLATLVYPGEEMELLFEIKSGTESGEIEINLGGLGEVGNVRDEKHKIIVYKPFELKNSRVSLWRQIWNRIILVISNY